MAATIRQSSRLSPEHDSLVGILAAELRAGVLSAQRDGLYPGSGLLLGYSRHGVSVSMEVPAEVMLQHEEHLLAHRLERALMKDIIQQLWRG